MRVWRFESSREWSVAAWLHSGLRVERGNQVVHGSESGVRQLGLLTRPSCLLRRHQRRTRVQQIFAAPNPPRGLARLELGTELVWTGITQLSGTDGATTPFTSLRCLLERKQIKKICVHNIPEGGDRSGASRAGVSRLSAD